MEWWVTPLVAIVVAAVGVSGAWLTVWSQRRGQQQTRLEASEQRADRLAARNFRLINYAGRLRAHIENGEPPPAEEWPNDLYG